MPCDAQAVHVFPLKEGMGQTQAEQFFGFLRQKITFRADIAHERHGKLFAQRIDGRIRHLRETLAEIIEEGARRIVERGQRFVVSCGQYGFLTLECHVPQGIPISAGTNPGACFRFRYAFFPVS